jgi:hypothetical protein
MPFDDDHDGEFDGTFALCVDGQNACPPEDCGGPPAATICSERSPIRPTRSTITSSPGSAVRSTRPVSTLALVNVRLQAVR